MLSPIAFLQKKNLLYILCDLSLICIQAHGIVSQWNIQSHKFYWNSELLIHWCICWITNGFFDVSLTLVFIFLYRNRIGWAHPILYCHRKIYHQMWYITLHALFRQQKSTAQSGPSAKNGPLPWVAHSHWLCTVYRYISFYCLPWILLNCTPFGGYAIETVLLVIFRSSQILVTLPAMLL